MVKTFGLNNSSFLHECNRAELGLLAPVHTAGTTRAEGQL